MTSYSVAIRTLGKNSEVLKQELTSIWSQTVKPEKVIVYIAKGFDRPSFSVGEEEYVWVKKGMISQRALQYREIDSECILLLDDDVLLAPDSAERMLHEMAVHEADCVGADTFKNQDMSIKSKLYAAATNLVFPHWDSSYAFKIHSNGSFSYLNTPKEKGYWSQSCAGPCSLWRKSSWLNLHIEDELWLEGMGFPYGEDALEFYKLFVNGGKLWMLYDSGVTNIDAKTSSGDFQRNDCKFYVRSMASLVLWHRMIYSTRKSMIGKFYAVCSFAIKIICLLLVNMFASLILLNVMVLVFYVKGGFEGFKFILSKSYRQLPSYYLEK